MPEHIRQEPKVLVSTENLTEQEWLAYRRQGIGGSDVAAILGISPFRTARDLYDDKLNIASAVDDRHTIAALYAFSQSVDRISSQQHRKGHVLPDAGRYALQRAGGRERNPLCLLPCHSHCRSPVPQLHDGQAFSE